MKKRLVGGFAFVICILPTICGFVFVFVWAGWHTGRDYAKAFVTWGLK